jgi:hypothetical protein
MTVEDQIEAYIAGQPEPKRSDLRALHETVRQLFPAGRLWFLDGRDDSGKTVSNPNIGYGSRTIRYADGSHREFYRIGLSANTSGISVYILGIEDKKYLAETYGARIGKAKVTGYCIRFRALKDIDLAVLEAAIRDGIEAAIGPPPGSQG